MSEPIPRSTISSEAVDGLALGVVVLGMGRSGTSAVTGMFVASGFFAGSDAELMAPSTDNLLGYYENHAVVEFNEALLNGAQGRWFDGPAAAPGPSEIAGARERLDALIARLVAEAGSAPIVVKDPRIGLLLAYWGPSVGGRLHPVLAVRDPIEVARSLLRRDGTPIPFGLAAWELHIRSVLSVLEGRTLTVAPYDALLGAAKLGPELVSIASAHLAPERAVVIDPARAVTAFDPGLRHNRAADGDHEGWMTASQLELWRLLQSLPPGDHVIELPAGSAPERGALTEAVSYERDRRLALERITALGEELRAAKESADAGEAALLAAERTLEAVRRSNSWRLTAPFRGVRSRRRGESDQVLP